jgi:hypothetical protein
MLQQVLKSINVNAFLIVENLQAKLGGYPVLVFFMEDVFEAVFGGFGGDNIQVGAFVKTTEEDFATGF